MENTTPKHKRTIASLAVCLLGVGLILTGTACPPIPPVCTCSTDADCDDGLFCNGPETCDGCNCLAGTNPCAEGETCDEDNDVCVGVGCESGADCAECEFCDVVTGECVPNENLYETAAFDHEFHQALGCNMCHHEAGGAAFAACDVCHNRDEVVAAAPVLKDAMHSPDGGCWQCHNEENPDGTRDCSVCHTALD